MQQLDVFGLLFPAPTVTVGAVVKDISIVGDIIPFRLLKDYIGKNVLYCSFDSYKVVRITDFKEDYEPVYQKSDEFVSSSGLVYDDYVNHYIHDVCMPVDLRPHYHIAYYSDRVFFSNKPTDKKGECSVAEHYCLNGRRDTFGYCDCNFYQIM